MLRAEVDLVLDTIQADTNGALRLTAIEVIDEQDLYLWVTGVPSSSLNGFSA